MAEKTKAKVNMSQTADRWALLEELKENRQKSIDARQRYDWEWLGQDLFFRGYHFARYNQSTNTVVFSTRTSVKIPVNLAWAQKRSVKNQVTSFRPKWEVTPTNPSDVAIWNAKMSSELLDGLFNKQELRSKTRGVVDYALIYGIGFWKMEWEPKLRNGDGEIKVTLVDPFDLYLDPRATSVEDAEYVTLVIARPVEVVKTNPNYERTEGLEGTGQTAMSEYKDFRNRAVGETGGISKDTVLLHETWQRERDKNGNVKMRITTWTESEIHRNEVVDQDEFPYLVYKGHDHPLCIYGESWGRNVIPINRVLDALESHIFEYNHLCAKGRYVVDKNAGVDIITNENGQIIEKNRGFAVTQLEMLPLPSTVMEQVKNFRLYMEDIGGAHDVSMGRLPTGIRSGLGIAELRQNDASNQNDLVESLEDFLESAGRKALKIYAEKLKVPRLIERVGKSAKEYFYVVGESGKGDLNAGSTLKKGKKNVPVATVGSENEIKVGVGSWLAYTKEAKQNQMFKWYEAGLIDQGMFLEHVDIGDVEGIMERTRQERSEGRGALLPGQSVRGGAARGGGPVPAGGMPPGEQPQGVIDQGRLAEEENQSFLNGREEPVNQDDDHVLHIQIHTPLVEQGNPQAQKHVAEHQVISGGV